MISKLALKLLKLFSGRNTSLEAPVFGFSNSLAIARPPPPPFPPPSLIKELANFEEQFLLIHARDKAYIFKIIISFIL